MPTLAVAKWTQAMDNAWHADKQALLHPKASAVQEADL